ncbi:MAG: hypothetical protein WCL07_01845 [bacterium]
MPNIINLITPNNLEEERLKFAASRSYNPIFRYAWQGQRGYPIFEDPIKQKFWLAIQSQDPKRIVANASKLFDVTISDDLTNKATVIARVAGPVHTGSAEEYKVLLDQALNTFGLSHFMVIIVEESGFNARPQPSKQRILVSHEIHYEFFSLAGGVRHELVHILRHVNGVYNRIKKSQTYLPTEEGLASWCQDNTSIEDRSHQQHAIEYIASSIGLNGSLRDIYNSMLDFGMSKELAWKRASRHKFGFVDTGKSGDILKPAMYFANEEKIDKLTTEEKLRLFVGKISLDELKDHPQYVGKWGEETLTGYFNL